MTGLWETLPSLRSFFKAALLGSQIPFIADPAPMNGPPLGTLRDCPNPSMSCPRDFAVSDTCCINAPGGQFAATQFWNSDAYSGPPGYLGPNNSWTIHGLWPDHCNGRYDSVCDCARSGDCSSRNRKCSSDTCNRDYSSITNILQEFGQDELLSYMGEYWKGIAGNEHLWQHEWSKHGTCVSTLEPKCYDDYESTQEVIHYFQRTVDVFKTLPSFEVYILKYSNNILTLTGNTVASSSRYRPNKGEDIQPSRYRVRAQSPPWCLPSNRLSRRRVARDLVSLHCSRKSTKWRFRRHRTRLFWHGRPWQELSRHRYPVPPKGNPRRTTAYQDWGSTHRDLETHY